MQATADSTKMDCVWSNWKSQGILFISVVHACGAHGNPGPGISHCASFHLWDLCMLYTQELSVGGSKLVMSKIRVDGVWFFVFVFYLSHLKKKKNKQKRIPHPHPFVFLLSGYCFKCIFCLLLELFWVPLNVKYLFNLFLFPELKCFLIVPCIPVHLICAWRLKSSRTVNWVGSSASF